MKGVDVLEPLVGRFIRTRSHIEERARAFANLFHDVLVQAAVRFFDEIHPAAPGAALVVDCTVCEIPRPSLPFQKAIKFFSGKHNIYCLKKEVCVNVRSGTAALITPEFTGSTHDIVLLRSHIDEVRRLLGQKTILGDLGYRGVQHELPNLIVCREEDGALHERRGLVERFFGRLKTLFIVFSTVWTMKEEFFDTFFDIAAALTNIDILNRPLQETDADFNRGVHALVLVDQQNRIVARQRANERYRERRRKRLGILDENSFDDL